MKLAQLQIVLIGMFAAVLHSTAVPPVLANEGDPTHGFFEVLKRNFANWDLNHDGTLTGDEIAEDLQDPNIKGNDAAALASLKVQERLDVRKEKHFDNFTMSEIDQLELAFSKKEKDATSLVSFYKGAHNKLHSQKCLDLFRFSTPDVLGIKQGRNSDCYFLASVASMAQARPQEFMSLYQKNNDGTYTVKFHNCPPITVHSPTPAEIATYPDDSNDGIWLNVIEKAFGKFLDVSQNKPMVEPLDAVTIHGGRAQEVISCITGHRSKYFKFDDMDVRERASETIANAVAQHKVIVTNVPGHELCILNYDRKSNQVLIWNPWGTSRMYGDGVDVKMTYGCFWLPLSEFLEKFVGMLIEQTDS